MKIILSPTKKMNVNSDDLEVLHQPLFLEKTDRILHWLRRQTRDELKTLWKCNDKILEQNILRLEDMDIHHALTPAILAYEGLAFQYMAPGVMEDRELDYLEEHLRILSGFYGVLRPFDSVTPYRLEMQAKAAVDGTKNLYDYWNRDLYDAVMDDSHIIINLASKEYFKCITPYLKDGDRMITIHFVEMVKGKLSTKGTYAKMARGEMVRFMAENQIEDIEAIKAFDRLEYHYREDLSSEVEWIFERRTDG